jgi:hypothetical protein
VFGLKNQPKKIVRRYDCFSGGLYACIGIRKPFFCVSFLKLKKLESLFRCWKLCSFSPFSLIMVKYTPTVLVSYYKSLSVSTLNFCRAYWTILFPPTVTPLSAQKITLMIISGTTQAYLEKTFYSILATLSPLLWSLRLLMDWSGLVQSFGLD